jgi:hypothetical protein
VRKYTIVILNQLNIKKKKSIKIILKKIIKITKGKKHCNNLSCFMRKFTVVIFNQLNIKNNKIDKDNFEKNYNKKKSYGETL